MNINIYSVRDNINSFETIKSLENKGIKAKSLTISRVNLKKIPNFKVKYDFLVVTSSNCIDIFLRYIFLYNKKFNTVPKVFVIGSETGNKLRNKNFFNFYEALGNSESLIYKILSNTKLYEKGLWLCGRHRNNKIKYYLFNKKRFLKPKVVYEMFARETISEYLIDSFKLNRKCFFIVKSSRNIELLSKILIKHELFEDLKNKSILVTISKTIYARARNFGWKEIEIIKETSSELFLKKFVVLLKSKNWS